MYVYKAVASSRAGRMRQPHIMPVSFYTCTAAEDCPPHLKNCWDGICVQTDGATYSGKKKHAATPKAPAPSHPGHGASQPAPKPPPPPQAPPAPPPRPAHAAIPRPTKTAGELRLDHLLSELARDSDAKISVRATQRALMAATNYESDDPQWSLVPRGGAEATIRLLRTFTGEKIYVLTVHGSQRAELPRDYFLKSLAPSFFV